MSKDFSMKIIAHIYNDYTEKFGIPRQSGIVESVKSKIIFKPEYRNPDAFRGIEGFSYLWLIWQFSEVQQDVWSPTVRPPKLGGNTKMGVFATRSPFRPNSIGLSSVKLEKVEFDNKLGPVITVSGADIMNGTPIFDIKPYLPYTDIHSDAAEGFALQSKGKQVDVVYFDEIIKIIPENKRSALIDILSQDPRPAYQNEPDRIYGMKFSEYNVKFTVKDKILKIIEIS